MSPPTENQVMQSEEIPAGTPTSPLSTKPWLLEPGPKKRPELPKPGRKQNQENVYTLSLGAGGALLRNSAIPGVAHIEATTRNAGGMRGVKVIEKALRHKGSSKWRQELWAAAGYDSKFNVTQNSEWLDLGKSVVYMELPSLMGATDDEKQQQAELLAEFASEHKVAIFQGANSAIGIRMFSSKNKGAKRTCLSLLLEQLGGGCIEVQQYLMSVMNACLAHPLGELGESLQSQDVKVLAYDFLRPIGTRDVRSCNAAGNTQVKSHPIYLSDAGCDGASLISDTVKLLGEIGGGQSRGFVPGGGTLKGTTWAGGYRSLRKPIRLSGGQTGFGIVESKFKSDNTQECLILDSGSMFKAGLKEHPSVKQALAIGAIDGIGVEIPEDLFIWFIVSQKGKTSETGTMASSFQEAPWRPSEGVKTAQEMENELKEWMSELPGGTDGTQAKQLARLIGEIEARARHEKSTVEISPVSLLRPLVQSVDNRFSRAASSGEFEKAIIAKVRGNLLVPAGCSVISTDANYGRRLETLRSVAHKRSPQVTPFCHSANVSLTLPLLAAFYAGHGAEGFSWEEDVLHCMNRIGRTDLAKRLIGTHELAADSNESVDCSFRQVLEVVRERHNWTVKTRKYTANRPMTEDEMIERLLQLAISMEGVARFRHQFFANPEDGRDRQEDHDGDDTVCDATSEIVSLHWDLEQTWSIAPRVCIEYSKKIAMSWRSERLKVSYVDDERAVQEMLNPKGMTLTEMYPNVDAFNVGPRLKLILSVTTVDPQGPTGLWSNVGGDCFARIEWEKDDYDRVTGPTEATERIFWLWIICAACIQLSIDWQKRAYELFLLRDWEALAKLFLEAGEKGESISIESIRDLGVADLDTDIEIYGREIPLLASNWCFSPDVVYGFVTQTLQQIQDDDSIRVCTWKQGRDGTWKSWADIMPQMQYYNAETRFHAVQLSAHAEDGWLSKADDLRKAAQKWASSVHKAYLERIQISGEGRPAVISNHHTLIDNLNARIPGALRAVAIQCQVSTEGPAALSKLSPRLRGRTLLSSFGFSPDDITSLSNGGTAKWGSLDVDSNVLLIWMMRTPATPEKGTVAAWQMFLHWIIACQSSTEVVGKIQEVVEDRFAWWCGFVNRTFASGNTKRVSAVVRSRMQPDRYKALTKSNPNAGVYLSDGQQRTVPQALGEASRLLEVKWHDIVLKYIDVNLIDALWVECEEDSVVFELVWKLVFRKFFAAYRAFKLMGKWKTKEEIGGVMHNVIIPPSGGSYQEYLKMKEDGYFPDNLFQGRENRKSYATSDGNMGMLYIHNGPSGKHRFVPGLYNGPSDPCYLTYQWLNGVAVEPPARLLEGLVFCERLLEKSWLVKSNSCFGKMHGYLDQAMYLSTLDDDAAHTFVTGTLDAPESLIVTTKSDENGEVVYAGIGEFNRTRLRRALGSTTEMADHLEGGVGLEHHHAVSYDLDLQRALYDVLDMGVGLPILHGKDGVKWQFSKKGEANKPLNERILAEVTIGWVLSSFRYFDHIELDDPDSVSAYDDAWIAHAQPKYDFLRGRGVDMRSLISIEAFTIRKGCADKNGKVKAGFVKAMMKRKALYRGCLEAYKQLGR